MRKFLASLIFLITIASIYAQGDIENSRYSSFYKDSTYQILGDVVNVRLNPGIEEKVIYKLNIGEDVRVLEDTQIQFTLGGYTANWYKVVYKNNQDKREEGYVWGGMIAIQAIESSTEKGLYFMYGASSSEQTEYREKVTVVVKVCKHNKEISKLEIPAEGGLSTYSYTESLGNKRIEGIKEVLKIHFSDEYCGGVFADAYLFWNGTNFIHAMTLNEGFDAPYYNTNQFLFPSDKNGNKKGYIINKMESGYYNDHNKNIITEKRIILYKWNGSEMVKVSGK